MVIKNLAMFVVLLSCIADLTRWYVLKYTDLGYSIKSTVLRIADSLNVASMVIIVIWLCSVLTGCAKDVAPIDAVVPAGAVTIKVPVPTCGDQLARSLYVVSNPRPQLLPINLLTEADKDDFEKVSAAYAETVQILAKYAAGLERDREESQLQCKAIRDQVDTLNTKTPVIPVQQ